MALLELIEDRIKGGVIAEDSASDEVPPINFSHPINFTPRSPYIEPPPSREDRGKIQRTYRWIFATISREATEIEPVTSDR